MKLTRLAAAAAAVAFALTAAGCASADTPPSDLTLTIGEVGNIYSGDGQNWSPLGTYAYQSNGQAVYDYLVNVEGDAEGSFAFTPQLATAWDFSDDNTVLSVTLREGVTFIDGAVFDAEALKANADYWREQSAALWILDAEVTGEYTLDFHVDLSLSRQKKLMELAVMAIASPDALADDPEGLVQAPVGSGPYILTEVELGVGATFTRNEDYWNVGAFPFETVVVKTFSDVIAAVNALKSGQIDIAPVDAFTAAEVEAAGFAIHTREGRAAGLHFNDRDGVVNPAIGDVRVRRAISMAFDREAIVENVDAGYAIASNQAWSSGWPEYRADLEDRYRYDPEGAKELLAEAGYPDGFDLVIPTFGAGAPGYDSVYGPIVQQSLAEIGIRVTYEQFSADQWYTTVTARPNAFAVTFAGSGFDNTIPHFIDSGALLATNPTVDQEMQDLVDVVGFSDQEESDAAAAELGEKVLDEAWLVVWSHPLAVRAYDDAVVNVTESSASPYVHWKYFQLPQ